jgi:hypothetical protein
MSEHYYPGSTRRIAPPRPAAQADAAPDADRWDAKPTVVTMGGETVELFSIGQLAQALERDPVTIRAWERDGIIPRAPYRTKSSDPRAKRRAYTRRHVEGMRAIAAEEGLLNSSRNKITDEFKAKILALFKELATKVAA